MMSILIRWFVKMLIYSTDLLQRMKNPSFWVWFQYQVLVQQRLWLLLMMIMMGLFVPLSRKNITYLTKFPKIGKKTAQQMILDLEGKFVMSEEAGPVQQVAPWKCRPRRSHGSHGSSWLPTSRTQENQEKSLKAPTTPQKTTSSQPLNVDEVIGY